MVTTKNKFHNVGRLWYVEPNDAYNPLPNGIPHPYEDYCISVDLSVEFGNRASCGVAGGDESVGKVYTYSSDRGTISFIGGTDGYLTTNYTDIESTNPEGNTNECLGIESIQVAYTSWYVPQVTIRFVDVRGASLMGPQEQGYVRTLREDLSTGHYDDTHIEGGSFFKALFSFPYPLFKLKVKGFYGKEVTYNLSVEKFEAAFNSDTGNFEIDAKFIGYMYGVYTDVPMSYLFLAPYIDDFGINYWKSEIASGRFTYLYNGAPIQTFPELEGSIRGIVPEVVNPESGGTSEFSEEITQTRDKKASLIAIRDAMNAILNEVFDVGHAYGKFNYAGGSKSYDYFFMGVSSVYDSIAFTEEDYKTRKDSKDSKSDKGCGKLYDGRRAYDNLISKITSHNKIYTEDQLDDHISNLIGFNKAYGVFQFAPETMSGNDVSAVYEVDNKGKVKTTTKALTAIKPVNGVSEDVLKNSGGKYVYDFDGNGTQESVAQWADRTYKSSPNAAIGKVLHLIVCHDRNNAVPYWIPEIEKRIQDCDDQLASYSERINENRSARISKALGFNTSIGNAFRMTFAHMETFIETFNHYLGQIHDLMLAGKRTLSSLDINVNDTDLPARFSSDTPVPPFTMFFKEGENMDQGSDNTGERSGKKKVYMWAGELKNKDELPEIDFVNKLIKAGKEYKADIVRYQNMKDANNAAMRQAESERETFAMVTNYDIAHATEVNPYKYLESTPNGNQVWELMWLTFMLRFTNWYAGHGGDSFNASISDKVGEIEAFNVYLAHPTVLPNIKTNLNGLDEDNIVKYVTDLLTKKSSDNNKKVFDLGQDCFNKEHVFYQSGQAMIYDWMHCSYKKVVGRKMGPDGLMEPITVDIKNALHFPIGNVNPIYIDVSQLPKTNERISNVKTQTFNNMTMNFIDNNAVKVKGKTFMYLDYKTRYLSKVKDAQDGILTGSAKDAYENYILPDFVATDYFLSNNFSAYQGVTTGLHTDSPAFPNTKENSKSYYVETPSFVIVNNTYHSLYGHPIFYAQNEIPDNRERLLAKAYLFLMGIPIHYATAKDKHPVAMPKVMALKEGAFWYRFLKISENITDADTESASFDIIKVPDGYKMASCYRTYAASNFSLNGNVSVVTTFIPNESNDEYPEIDEKSITSRTYDEQVKFADLFEKWATEVFPTINEALELRLSIDDITTENYDGFVKLVNLVKDESAAKKNVGFWKRVGNWFTGNGKYKFGPLFVNSGGRGGKTSVDFYDPDGEVKASGQALVIPVQKVSDMQAKLLELYGSYTIVLRTDRFTSDCSVYITDFQSAIKGFFKSLKRMYKDQLEGDAVAPLEASNMEPVYDPERDVDLKISTYMTLKNLYDRWLCMNRNADRWKIDGGERSEFAQFRFVDSFYRKIENRMIVNFEQLVELATQIMATSNVKNDSTNLKYMGQSFYEFLAEICQKNQALLLALPMENEFTNPEGIKDLFDVKPYSRIDNRDTSCYVCLYSNKPSEHLEVAYDSTDYMYAPDGFNIANAYGEVLEAGELLPQLTDVEIDGYQIPAFGVTAAKQNQSLFKKISVNMMNPQVTEASIAATQLIAAKGETDVNQTALYGQDLYRIYANYSYTCVVEMLGDAQIMPLTYFQLNNIPLFRGTYMIINIEHSIRAGDMVTKFTGVRMSRFDTPLVRDRGIFAYGVNYGADGYGYTTDSLFSEFDANYVADGNHKYNITFGMLAHSNAGENYNKTHAVKVDVTPRGTKDEKGSEVANLYELVDYMQEFQDAWVAYCEQNPGQLFSDYQKFYISCGFRCNRKNSEDVDVNGTLIGSNAPGHPMGIATDFWVVNSSGKRDYRATEELFKFIVRYCRSHDKKWGEIIIESYGYHENRASESRWVHFAFKNSDNKSQACRTRRYTGKEYYGEAVDNLYCFNSPTYCGR